MVICSPFNNAPFPYSVAASCQFLLSRGRVLLVSWRTAESHSPIQIYVVSIWSYLNAAFVNYESAVLINAYMICHKSVTSILLLYFWPVQFSVKKWRKNYKKSRWTKCNCNRWNVSIRLTLRGYSRLQSWITFLSFQSV